MCIPQQAVCFPISQCTGTTGISLCLEPVFKHTSSLPRHRASPVFKCDSTPLKRPCFFLSEHEVFLLLLQTINHYFLPPMHGYHVSATWSEGPLVDKPRTNTFRSSLHNAEKHDAGKHSTELWIKSCCAQSYALGSVAAELWSPWGCASMQVLLYRKPGCPPAASFLWCCLCSLLSALLQNACSDATAGVNLTWKSCNCNPKFLTLFFHAVSC